MEVQDLHTHLCGPHGLRHLRGGDVLYRGGEPGRRSIQGHAVQYHRDIREYVSLHILPCSRTDAPGLRVNSVRMLKCAGV